MANFAVIVALDGYGGIPGLKDLEGAVADAEDFAEWALHPEGGGVEPHDLHIWTYPEVTPAQDHPLLRQALNAAPDWPGPVQPDFKAAPDSVAIIDGIEGLARKAAASGPDARLFVFFAGHGVRIDTLSYNRDFQTCLVAGNHRPGTTLGLVPIDDIRRYLERLGPPVSLLFQDCCRTDMVGIQDQILLHLNLLQAQRDDIQWVVGNAARSGRIANEIPFNGQKRGAFTKVLVQALRQFRPPGGLTASALRGFVSRGVSIVVAPKRQQSEIRMRFEEDDCVIVDGPAIGPVPVIAIVPNGHAGAGTLSLFDGKGEQVAQFPASQATIRHAAPVGFYSLRHAESGTETSFFHLGPEDTNVSI